jgi:hypothetical protein
MSTPDLAPEPEPRKWTTALVAAVKWAAVILLVAAVSAGAAWEVFSYRIRQEQAGTAAQVTQLREEVRQRQDELKQQQDALTSQVQQVQKAAEDARLLVSQNGQTVTLDARLKEIDTLRVDLKKTQDELDAKLKAMEQSVVDQVAKQGKETAQALSVELRWKSLLIKAQGEVLLAQVHWAEGNRGLAKDELGIAVKTLQQAQAEAPETVQAQLRPVLDLAEQARSALIMEQSSARDSLNMLWHRVSDMLAVSEKP